jgi:tetratricopeptide (TPR) repeat protein
MAEAMRLDPENAVVLNYQLMFHIFENNKNHQVDTLHRIINSTSSELIKLINLGIYNIHNKNYKTARENFRQAFLLNPTDKDLLATLEDLDKNCSILFLPNRLIDKIGAPIVWLSFIALIIILGFLNLKTLQGAIALVYVSLALYTWIARFLYYFSNKIRNKTIN